MNSIEGWFFQFIAGLFLVVAFFSFSDFFEKIRFKRRTAPHLLRIRELELEFREVVNQLYGRWAGSLIEKELLESELIGAVAGKVDLFYASTVNNPSYINEKGMFSINEVDPRKVVRSPQETLSTPDGWAVELRVSGKLHKEKHLWAGIVSTRSSLFEPVAALLYSENPEKDFPNLWKALNAKFQQESANRQTKAS